MLTELATIFKDMRDPAALRQACASNAVHRRTIIFCMTARVGSTALLSLLSNKFGFPYIEEIFNGRDVAPGIISKNKINNMAEYLSYWNNSIPESMIFSFKTNWSDFEWCVEGGFVDILFPNASYIYLDRVNIDAQAVSLYCASMSGKWHRYSGKEFERREIPYDKSLIDEAVWILGQDKLKWQKFFSAKEIMPTTVFYEAILGSPKGALKRLISDLGLSGDTNVEWSDAIVNKTDDPRQFEILDRYRSERYAGI